MVRIRLLLLTLLLAVTTSPGRAANISDVWLSITAEELQYHVYTLCKAHQGRKYGSPGNAQGADYIEAVLKQTGMRTHRQGFIVHGSTRGENIMCWTDLPASASHRHEVILVGAHRDTVGNAGADDNTSGTAVVLELAQAVSMLDENMINRTIVFMLFDVEEIGMYGSEFYASHPIFPLEQPSIRNHVGMINLDMVGRSVGVQRRPSGRANLGKVNFGGVVTSLAPRWNGAWAHNLVDYGSGPSDHTPFYQRGVPIVMVSTGTAASPYYHQPGDLPDTLDYDNMEGIGRFTFEMLLTASREKR